MCGAQHRLERWRPSLSSVPGYRVKSDLEGAADCRAKGPAPGAPSGYSASRAKRVRSGTPGLGASNAGQPVFRGGTASPATGDDCRTMPWEGNVQIGVGHPFAGKLAVVARSFSRARPPWVGTLCVHSSDAEVREKMHSYLDLPDPTPAGVGYGPRQCILSMRNRQTTDGATLTMTIGRLARAAGVGVETIRYYQGRGLLPVPPSTGGIRYYAPDLVARIGFIKRAQGLGFSLDEIATLLNLADGRNRGGVRAVTSARLEQIRAKLVDLSRMQRALDDLLANCMATGEVHPCPIIEALLGGAT